MTAALAKLENWIEREQFLGWDPFDALNSPLLKKLSFNNRKMGQVWVQLFKRSPLNLRPLLGVSKGYNPKGMGLFLASYWRRYLTTGQSAYLERTRFFADWLQANVSPGYHGACWGYNFDWPNRGFFAPAGTPTLVNTAFIGLAFADLAVGPEVPAALQLARSACDFINSDLQKVRPAEDELGFSYTPLDSRVVHNANGLGAWLLAEVASQTSEPELAQTALAAARYTARRQRADGSWWYGEWEKDHWVDNFHTGFVLVALRRIGLALRTTEFEAAVARGYAFWKDNFFTPAGAPKYYPDRLYPIDIHSAAQAILTFLAFAAQDASARASAERVARWAVENMQASQGFFHFQRERHYRIKIPYMRWSQAWMFRALTELEWGAPA